MPKAMIRKVLATRELRLLDIAIKTRAELESKEIRRKTAVKKQLSIAFFLSANEKKLKLNLYLNALTENFAVIPHWYYLFY